MAANLTPEQVDVVVAIIAATALIFGAILTWRSSVRKSALEELRALITEEKDRRKELSARVDTLEEEREKDSRWIASLRDHIYRQKPPPPPNRPD